ncbi:MAG TPA: disulfide bond formation protein B [Bauldia sp.]|nr:disulfide bond formation protein B [Bauldia sp.]
MTSTATRRHEMLAPLVVFLVGLATILGAWGFEIFGGFVPCALCLQERVPYYFGLPFALAGVLAALAGAKPTIPRMLLIASGIAFAYNVYLGGYHAGAEWGFWAGPSDCGAGGAAPPTSAEDLLSQIKTIRIVSCTEATWRFLYLSFAGWNFVVSLFLAAVAFWGAFRPLPPDEAAQRAA